MLHLDQVRNHDKKFYPFRFPSIEQITEGRRGHNWSAVHSCTNGMADEVDNLHTRNYGACMAARKSDLLRIGGADEHLDYLGYICGPYDMTFRLINAGVKEVWHKTEYIYHVWHPAAGGGPNNREGPHDGKNMSSRALSNIKSKRILPFVQNPALANGGSFVTDQTIKEWTLSK